MDMQQAIRAVVDRRDLSEDEMQVVMRLIMTGEATPAQIGGFLVALRMKGETVAEITGAARVMRALATPVQVSSAYLVDTCGTGGDGSHTFNISTAVAFVAAAAGCHVAKHGNRSVSGKSGSADVLEAAGVFLGLTPEQVARAIESIGVGFLFAPQHHSAMKHAIGPRREMGVRTVFNVLGPLTNPAGVRRQVLGVFSRDWLQPLAEVLRALGSEHVLVVHAEDGLDELSLAAETQVVELKNGQLQSYAIAPERFGIQRRSLSSLVVNDVAESYALVQKALCGTHAEASDIVAMNAAAAIYVAGRADTLEQGFAMARDVIASGQAWQKLEDLVSFTDVFRTGGAA